MIIYKTINLINGKSYVGKDSNDDSNYLGSGVYLNRAIKKYGKENFLKETIAWCYTKEHLDWLERFYIQYFDTKAPDGYNLTDGGDGAAYGELNIMKRPEIAEKHGKRMKENNPMKRPEVKEKASHSFFKRGIIPWNKGFTKETDERIRNCGFSHGDLNPMKQPKQRERMRKDNPMRRQEIVQKKLITQRCKSKA